ncbi:exodeoxyribonuclease VII small subunit [Pandoraea sp.]|uniref:exodeoxyribonuclease VII small subunit n=1 Tax=Pandoraea sp. TaxID=1883445 RepID=UPI00120A5F40|nr:exodeoxyribonuclease VII small subunit [Pandoraea sp.]TAL57094.1 MAG: exodeoxyribonuclease VII small subunit [Pandoraea sp.]TAM18136.1 MAG: exodeoxyribonuclease VII small subunit [Pandoraea sp.]
MAKTVTSTEAQPSEAPPSYEAALAELEQLVGRMESGELGLEASLTAYRRGAELVKYCQGMLARVEQQVKVLENDTLEPLDTAPADE